MDINGEFPVSDSPIKLTVDIQPPNWGKSMIWIEDRYIDFGENIVNHQIVPKGSDERGNTVYVKTPVVDFDDSSKDMQIIYTLDDGQTKKSFPGKQTVANNGDTGLFWGIFKLV